MQIQNKVFFVTGGGNGIGRELVLILISKGARVIAIDKDEAGLMETQHLIGVKTGNFFTHHIDVTNFEAVSRLPDQILATHCTVDGLINAAGTIQAFQKINSLDYAEIMRVMDNNYYGMVYMTKAFLPHLLTRPEAIIVNFSSMGGFLPVPGQGVYGASKAAVKLFTEALFAELLSSNVQVSLVFPGAVDTDIAAHSGVTFDPAMEEMGREKFKPMPPGKAAEIIVAGIEKDRYRIFIGSDAKMMNILYRVAPKFAAKFITKQMGSLLG